MRDHRVRSFNWIDGKLVHRDDRFMSLESAMKFVEDLICETFKIFDDNECVVHEGHGKHHHHHHRHHHHHHGYQ